MIRLHRPRERRRPSLPAKFHHRVNMALVGEVLALKAARRMIAGTVVERTAERGEKR